MTNNELLKRMEVELKVNNLRWLISCNPADVKLLKKEYLELTGKRYRKSKKDWRIEWQMLR